MITTVDKNGIHEVQKITKPNGKLVRYQATPIPAGDYGLVKVFISLEDARAFIGKTTGGKVKPLN